MTSFNFFNFLNIFQIIFLLYLVHGTTTQSDDSIFKLVHTNNGYVRGLRQLTLFEKYPFYSFKGIPYAKPPLGKLRFKPPEKLGDRWPNVLNAYDFGNKCLQMNYISRILEGDEDCLYLNIYVPSANLEANETFAVIIYIHGGAFSGGSSDRFGPDFIMPHSVILVTINYRLGPLGFLSLNIPEYSGNMGLKDQVMAIQWIRDNIDRFGGDRDRITLYGQSAGAAAADYHLFSPLSKGLFKRAILSSCSSLTQGSFTTINHTELIMALGLRYFYPIYNLNDVMNFLNEVDPKILVKEIPQPRYQSGFGRKIFELIWAPVIEHPKAINPYLSESPNKLFFNNSYNDDVDTIMGSVNTEAGAEYRHERDNPGGLESFFKHFEISLPLKTLGTLSSSKESKAIVKKIRQFYFKNETEINNTTLHRYRELIADIWSTYSVYLRAKRQAKYSSANTFYYEFAVDGQLNFNKIFYKVTELEGAIHSDDLNYVFLQNTSKITTPSAYADLKPGSLERNIIWYMNKLFSNFAKYGHPAPNKNPTHFPQFQNFSYVQITKKENPCTVLHHPNKENFKFWDGMLEEYKGFWMSESNKSTTINHCKFILILGLQLILAFYLK